MNLRIYHTAAMAFSLRSLCRRQFHRNIAQRCPTLPNFGGPHLQNICFRALILGEM
jgi:hypothetical protein